MFLIISCTSSVLSSRGLGKDDLDATSVEDDVSPFDIGGFTSIVVGKLEDWERVVKYLTKPRVNSANGSNPMDPKKRSESPLASSASCLQSVSIS